MWVSTVGLDDNPETLIARAKHVAGSAGNNKLAWLLDDMYDDQMSNVTETRTIGQTISELVKLGFQVGDWTGATVDAIWPLTEQADGTKIKVTLVSRVTKGCKVEAKLSPNTAQGWVADMEASGLWIMSGAEWVFAR